MTTYKTFITVENPDHVVLSNLPFQQGQRVRVVILTDEPTENTVSQRFRDLFRKTQNLSDVKDITEA